MPDVKRFLIIGLVRHSSINTPDTRLKVVYMFKLISVYATDAGEHSAHFLATVHQDRPIEELGLTVEQMRAFFVAVMADKAVTHYGTPLKWQVLPAEGFDHEDLFLALSQLSFPVSATAKGVKARVIEYIERGRQLLHIE